MGWGTHVNPRLIHVSVWQKTLQYCEVISLQLIKINGKKKRVNSLARSGRPKAGANVIVPGLSSITSGTCFASLGGLSSAQTSGNCVNSLSLDCLAHPVSLLGDGAASIHLERLPRGRINRW